MADKSPFEIRLEVLQMAKDYMDKQAEIQMDFALASFTELVKFGKKSAEQWAEYAPKQYSSTELMEKAAEFYSFISSKK